MTPERKPKRRQTGLRDSLTPSTRRAIEDVIAGRRPADVASLMKIALLSRLDAIEETLHRMSRRTRTGTR